MRLIFVEYVPHSLVCALYPLCFSIFLGYPLPLPKEVVLYQFNKGGKGVACKVKQVAPKSPYPLFKPVCSLCLVFTHGSFLCQHMAFSCGVEHNIHSCEIVKFWV